MAAHVEFPVMIDWLKIRVPCAHTAPVEGGLITKECFQSGEIEEYRMRYKLEGSASTVIMVNTLPAIPENTVMSGGEGRGSIYWPKVFGYSTAETPHKYLEIEGNFVKYFQGHNLFGSSDLIGLVLAMVEELSKTNPVIQPTQEDLDAIRRGEFVIQRVDLTSSFMMKNLNEALEWIKACEMQAEYRGRGQFRRDHNTLYIGKNSRRESVKIYPKGVEFSKQIYKISTNLDRMALKSFSEKLVRIEWVLRKMSLQRRGWSYGTEWRDEAQIAKRYSAMVETIEMSGSVVGEDEAREKLTKAELRLYLLWKNGVDCSPEGGIVSKATGYRYRKPIMEKLGVNIFIPNSSHKAEVKREMKVLSYAPLAIPSQFLAPQYFYEPQRKVA